MSRISIVTACRNEEGTVGNLHQQTKYIFDGLRGYSREHIFIDSASTDGTTAILKAIAQKDKHVRVIVSSRDFGHIRSSFYGLLQARGDAVIFIGADLLDNPSLIVDFIKKWEQGYGVIVGVSRPGKGFDGMSFVRDRYYALIERFSEAGIIRNFTGVGLYDQRVIEILRGIHDPYPYLAGLIGELGFKRAQIEYARPGTKTGPGKSDFYSRYDLAMLGMINHSRVPLRLAIMLGVGLSAMCFCAGLGYLMYKLIFWGRFPAGIAPLVIGFFFLSSVQLSFIGIIGEYAGNILTQVKKMPMVIEKERINF